MMLMGKIVSKCSKRSSARAWVRATSLEDVVNDGGDADSGADGGTVDDGEVVVEAEKEEM